MNEPWYARQEREAAEKVAAIMALPMPEDEHDIGTDRFDPWEIFPALFGSYSSDFDKCAIEVLGEVLTGYKVRDDLGAEMFREMLCTGGLCDYGTSPRVCFPTSAFKTLLPKLIEMWRAWSLVHWGEDVCAE